LFRKFGAELRALASKKKRRCAALALKFVDKLANGPDRTRKRAQRRHFGACIQAGRYLKVRQQHQRKAGREGELETKAEIRDFDHGAIPSFDVRVNLISGRLAPNGETTCTLAADETRRFRHVSNRLAPGCTCARIGEASNANVVDVSTTDSQKFHFGHEPRNIAVARDNVERNACNRQN
jgi:hypothetical protein